MSTSPKFEILETGYGHMIIKLHTKGDKMYMIDSNDHAVEVPPSEVVKTSFCYRDKFIGYPLIAANSSQQAEQLYKYVLSGRHAYEIQMFIEDFIEELRVERKDAENSMMCIRDILTRVVHMSYAVSYVIRHTHV
eukprot:356622-Chlamydomonas_euryale.AAC.1